MCKEKIVQEKHFASRVPEENIIVMVSATIRLCLRGYASSAPWPPGWNFQKEKACLTSSISVPKIMKICTKLSLVLSKSDLDNDKTGLLAAAQYCAKVARGLKDV